MVGLGLATLAFIAITVTTSIIVEKVKQSSKSENNENASNKH